MSFTEAEKTDIRRFCGYGVFGAVPTANFGDRYFTYYGLLEYRMQHLTEAEEDVVRDVYLDNLTALELAIPATSDNLDTAKAAVWTHNANEQSDRDRLFTSWRIRLAKFFNIPYGETGSATARMVV